MKNADIAIKIYNQIENSEEFLEYKKRWIKMSFILPLLIFISTLFCLFVKMQGFIPESINLNYLYITNMIAFTFFMRSFYKNSHDILILNFFSNQKLKLNNTESIIILLYLNSLLEKNSLFKNKKQHFLLTTEKILSTLKESELEELKTYYNLKNF